MITRWHPHPFHLISRTNMRAQVLEVNAYPWMAWETEWGKQ